MYSFRDFPDGLRQSERLFPRHFHEVVDEPLSCLGSYARKP